MVNAGDIRELAMVPVRGTVRGAVYVVKLPFVLVWMVVAYTLAFIYSIFAKVVSVPANYVRRAARRIQLTWNWTKSSAKSMLPWRSSAQASAVARGPESYHMCGFAGRQLELRGRPRSKHGRRSRKKAIISSLIRVLLEETGSPPESEEEAEMMTRSGDGDGDESVYQLIRDLVQFSRSRTSLPGGHRMRLHGPVLDLETLRERARNREELNGLISEIEQYIRTMDAPAAAAAGVHRENGMSGFPTHSDTGHYAEGSEETLSGTESAEEHLLTSEEEEEEFDDAHSTLSRVRGLSPVAEVSPEAGSTGSTESLNKNCGVLESELDTALSRLSTLTDELTEVEESIVETKQTKHTETVTFTTRTESSDSFEDASDEFSSIPKTSPTLGLEAGHSRRALATARNARPPSLSKGNQQGRPDRAGDSRKAREASKEIEEDFSGAWSEEEEEEEEKEGKRHSLSDQLRLLSPTSLRQHGQDQQEFDPAALYSTVNKRAKTSSSEGDSHQTGKTVTKVRSHSLPESTRNSVEPAERSLFIHDLTPPWKRIRSRNSNSNSSSADSPATTPSHTTSTATSFQMPPAPLPTAFKQSPSPLTTPRRSLTPPSVPPRPQHSSTHPTVPHLQPSSAPPMPSPQHSFSDLNTSMETYDRLPRALPAPPIPNRAGEEGMYDIIPGHRQRPKYLHERLAASNNEKKRRETPPVSWTPQLPPRNPGSRMKRTCSADAMGTLDRDQGLVRSGSERRASSSSAHDPRERSSSSSSSSSRKVHSSSTDRDRDRDRERRKSSSDHHHSHRSGSGERSSSSDKPRRSSSEKHRSPDKKSSSSSSDRKSSSSSDRKSSSSSDRKSSSSSDKKSSSEKKSSPTSEKKSSSASKTDSTEGGGSFIWRLLSGPVSSKSKSSSSSSKESSSKERESSKDRGDREERAKRGERERERRHSSSSRSSKESPTKMRSHHSRRSGDEGTPKRKADDPMPRNSSSASLRSGVSMQSTDSSGRESLI